MQPTLQAGAAVAADEGADKTSGPARGDIIVFGRNPRVPVPSTGADIAYLIKRVVGLGRETIESTPDGHVEINGQILDESYLPPGTALGPPIAMQVIPPGHYFVMGDNRTNSSDSRFFGPIAAEQIIGRVATGGCPRAE